MRELFNDECLVTGQRLIKRTSSFFKLCFLIFRGNHHYHVILNILLPRTHVSFFSYCFSNRVVRISIIVLAIMYMLQFVSFFCKFCHLKQSVTLWVLDIFTSGNHLKCQPNGSIAQIETLFKHLSSSHLFGSHNYSQERQKPKCLSRFVRAAGNPGSYSEQMV